MKKKKPLSIIAYRIGKNINVKTLDFINKQFMNGVFPQTANIALELYCRFLIKEDVIEYIKSMDCKKEGNKHHLRKPKQFSDIISFRLSKNISQKVLNIVNEYYFNNDLSMLIGESLEFYRIIYELLSKTVTFQDDKKEEVLEENNANLTKEDESKVKNKVEDDVQNEEKVKREKENTELIRRKNMLSLNLIKSMRR